MGRVVGRGPCVVGLVIFLSFLVTAYAAEQKAPEAFSWDFGKVKEGTVLKHDFIFKNESKSVLTINGVATSCGCTVSEVKKKILQPQESTLLHVEFKTKSYSGPVKQYIFVTTDILDNPVTRFIIEAEVIRQ